MKKLAFVYIIVFLAGIINISAQSIPVGSPLLESYYQRLQLEGKLDSSISFTVRPVFPAAALNVPNVFRPDTTGRESWLNWDGEKSFAGGRGAFQMLPVTWEQGVSSHHPYSWNDGSMIPAKGYQTRLSGGIFVKYGPLNLQLRPEIVSASNRPFDGFNTEHAPVTWAYYYSRYLNVTDIPERFGDGTYHSATWGQSSIRLIFDPLSIGISNENLWWGPGKRNSLLMSNNAPGFKHLTLNTTRPVRTPIGSFEGQMVAGRLENSGYLPPEPNRIYNSAFLYRPKHDDWRYLSSLVFTYNPRWVPGLFLGMSRAFQMYGPDLDGSLGDYIPLFQPFQKNKTNEANRERDQLASLFARYLLTESKGEVYFEYGFNDHSADIRDFLMDPEHSRAYLVGFSKIIPLQRRANEYILANLEVTQLSQGATSLLRDAGSWYLHWQIRQGYTHKGQVLGAGIGPGGNLQSLNVSWYKGLKRVGLQFERYIHNNDFYQYAFAHTGDYRKRWVDLSAAVIGEWNYKNLLVNANATVIRSLNYQYWLIDQPVGWHYAGRDVFNFSGQLGIMYRF